MNRSILADMLGEEYEILEAENGLEAVSTIQKHHMEIDLLLLDIVMPEMDGFEVLTVMNRKSANAYTSRHRHEYHKIQQALPLRLYSQFFE